ncbi:hypothetical protein ACHAXT_006070 [Thalassiosira profunda]
MAGTGHPVAKIIRVLRNPESYPLTITLLRNIDDDSSTTPRSLDELCLGNNMFVRYGDWSRTLNLMIEMNFLTSLHLDSNLIGHRGSTALATLLRRKKSKLKYLSLRDNLIDDTCLAIFAEALRGNDTLEYLDVYGSNREISESGWKCVLDLLCDESSIEGTFTSNHTLKYLGGWDFAQICPWIGWRLNDMLSFNRQEHSPGRFTPARRKTWFIHFGSDNFGLQALDIDVKLMPRMLTWFTKHMFPCESVRLRTLYRLVLQLPELFGNPSAERVRIGSRVAELESEVEQLKAEIRRLNAKNNELQMCPSKRMRVK